MTTLNETLVARIETRFGQQVSRIDSNCGELTCEVSPGDIIAVATALRDDSDFSFEQLIDSQRRLAEAEVSYYRELIDFEIARENVNRESGKLLMNYNVLLQE